MEKETSKHPSYGMIGFSKVSCSGNNRFFGSDLPVSNYIEIKIHAAEIDRDLSHDRYHALHQDRLISVKMTHNQFAELLTGGNMGDGVPCTITEVMGNDIEQEADFENRKQYTHRMFKQRMLEFNKQIVEKQQMIKTLTAKKTLSAEDQKQLNWAMDWLTQEMTKNIPFFMECFQETMDKVVTEAKSEVENAILTKAQNYGLQVLQGRIPVLEIDTPGKQD